MFIDFSRELSMIQNVEIREQTAKLIKLFPSYFWSSKSSSTGKYHAIGESLFTHTCRDVKVFNDIAHLEQFGLTQEEIDYGIAALIIHDSFKYGIEKHEYTQHEHPLIAADFVMSNASDDHYACIVANAIASHSGEWTKSKYSKVELPKPETMLEKVVHLADYIASRRYINVDLDI